MRISLPAHCPGFPLTCILAGFWCGGIPTLCLAEAPLPEKISFNRDIRPIMSDTCFHCHGFDANTREADLRLDLPEEAFKKTSEGVVPIVPGDIKASEILVRIFDDEDPMPPEKAHKPLTDRQKALFRQWVAEGAHYETHWAYAPLERPPIPDGQAETAAIDAFVKARLAVDRIELSEEADRATLLRRLSFDLTGLPPTPEEVAAFVSDPAPDAYVKQVDRLLASPHFGERLAVWWLDIARFADTVGFHGDQYQRIFPYRDYVINAFNENKGFDQFTIEQLAGDLLPKPSTGQLVATGYNRLNMMTREGGAQPKEYLAKYGAERVRAVSAAWFGSTFGCAECHDHKFDPIKAHDFYALQAFFADLKQWGVYSDYGYTPEPELKGVNNDYPFYPEIQVISPYLKKQADANEAALADFLDQFAARMAHEPKLLAMAKSWLDESVAWLPDHPSAWVQPVPVASLLEKGKPRPEPAPATDGKAPAVVKPAFTTGADGTITLAKALGKEESLQLEFSASGLPRLSSVRVELPATGLDDAARTAGAGKTLKVALSVRGADGKVRKAPAGTGEATAKRPIFVSGAEVTGSLSEWRLPYDALAADAPADAWSAVWRLDVPMALATDEVIIATISGDSVLPLRVSFSPFAALNPLEAASESSLALVRKSKADQLSQNPALLETWLISTAAERKAFDDLSVFAKTRHDLRGGAAWSMVTEAVAVPRTVRLLPRGNFLDETGPVVLPATPSFLPGRLESTDERRYNRLDLAQWIVSEANPLTARALMNRTWQLYFGTGLSAVVDDLGSQGEPPSHPELLDWLASEFRSSGWDMKHMIRLMVTSATYRQSSKLRPERQTADPDNRLLASQNPRRLDAEFVRDNALFVAGQLQTSEIGGPSVKPYQPDGYYAALQFPDRDYVATASQEQWRRSVYMHWQRTFLHPMLANFDAPARDECAAMRTKSNTPQQALTLLNDPIFVEAARLFAVRIHRDATLADDAARLTRAYWLALAREPQSREAAALLQHLASQREHYASAPEDAAKLLATGFAPVPTENLTELAAWTSVCRVLLNLHETITRY
jgi:Protein of unknown function (DUF1553)/Protein of unknown function (DUF1549)/Planctomycete cytochrome C